MTGDQIIITIIAFILSYITTFFLRGFFRKRRIVRVFLEHGIVSEETSQKLNDIPLPFDENKSIRLLPFVYLFKKNILKVTKDNRVYLNKTVYHKKITYDFLMLFIVYLVFIGVILLTIYL